MELSLYSLLLLPMGLGLFGFIEPCTIGGHLVFLNTQNRRARSEKIGALLVFLATRSIITGLFGAAIAFVGSRMIGAQTGLWLVFGTLYLAVGVFILANGAGMVKQRVNLAPAAWKQAQNPFVLGLAFGLNIPACSAPILFGLLGLAATTGTVFTGFAMMFVFGFFLSAPLFIFALMPSLTGWLSGLGQKMKGKGWILGLIFIALGIWSIYFGLYVDPANWVGT